LKARDVQIEHSFSSGKGDLEPTVTFGVLKFFEFSFVRLKPDDGQIPEFPPASPIDASTRSNINKGKRIREDRGKRFNVLA